MALKSTNRYFYITHENLLLTTVTVVDLYICDTFPMRTDLILMQAYCKIA